MEERVLKIKIRKMLRALRPMVAETRMSRRIEGYISTEYSEKDLGVFGILVDASLSEDVAGRMLTTVSHVLASCRSLMAYQCQYMLYTWKADRIVRIGRPLRAHRMLEKLCHTYSAWGQFSVNLMELREPYVRTRFANKHDIMFLITTYEKLDEVKDEIALFKKNTIALYPAAEGAPEIVKLRRFPAFCVSEEESAAVEKGDEENP